MHRGNNILASDSAYDLGQVNHMKGAISWVQSHVGILQF